MLVKFVGLFPFCTVSTLRVRTVFFFNYFIAFLSLHPWTSAHSAQLMFTGE